MADSQEKITDTMEKIFNTVEENKEISRDMLDLMIKGAQMKET
jgi:hypothetical protein